MTTTHPVNHPAGLPGTPPGPRSAAHVPGYTPPAARRRRSRTRGRLLAVLVVSFLLGLALGRIPSPARVGDLWVGNLAAPYLVVPALAGAWAGRRLLGAAVAGAVSGAGLVLGFYDVLDSVLMGLRPDAGLRLGIPDVSALGASVAATRGWVEHQVLTGYGTPWLTVAVVVGLVMGPVGYVFRRASGFVLVVLAAALVAGPFLAEAAFHVLASAGGLRSLPVIGSVGWPMTPRNALVVSCEAAVGAITQVALVVFRFLPTRAISLG